MANYAHYWKVWLRLNLLTADVDNDYIAEVSTTKTTLHYEELARRIVAEGSEIKYDTLLSILSQRDRIVRQALQEGLQRARRCVSVHPPHHRHVKTLWHSTSHTGVCASHKKKQK